MNVFVPRILTSLLVCMTVIHTVQAQDDLGAVNQPGVASVPEPVASPPLISDAPGQAVMGNYFGYTEVQRVFEPQLRVDSRTSALYGYRDGYTRISAFMPKFLDDDSMLFADLGGFASYNPSGGANLGVGWRGYFEDLDRILGLSGWFDVDNANQRTYQQFGLSLESLGRYTDWRVNGYMPLGQVSNTLREVVSGPAFFYTNNIMLNRLTWREAAYTGLDAEIGGPTPILGRYGLSAYAGMYFFNAANVGGFTGVSGRIQGQINDSLTIGAQVTHDHVFDTNAQIQVTVTIPDGKPGRWLRQLSVRQRMTQPVFRNYRTIVHEDFIVKAEQAFNPVDNQPFFVVHVDPNQAAGTGNGTYEHPYSQLSQFDTLPGGPKSNVDIVYVHPNVDGSSTNLDAGVTLLSNQRLLSTAVPHTFTAIQGTFDLPGYVSTDLPPVLTNASGGDVVTFATGAQNIEVSGFTINGSATGNGIFGFGNRGVNINRNTFEGGSTGVLLGNLAGTVADGQEAIIDQNNFLNNLGDGLFIDNVDTAPLEVFLTRNTATGNEGNAFAFSSAGTSSIGGIISGNSTEITDATTQTANLNNGLALYAQGGVFDFFNAANGWQIGGPDTGTDDNIYNDANSFSDNGNFGINVVSTNNSLVRVRMANNDFARNSLNGLGFLADSGQSIIEVGGSSTGDGNRFLNNGLNGLLIDLGGTAVGQLNIQNNTFTQNGASGAGGGGGAGGTSLYNIDVVFNGGLTPSQEAIFALAAAKWESIIVGDVPDINGIDDIQISAEGADIDGSGNVLGQAGPTAFRPTTFLPYQGQMQFDTADLADLESAGQLDEVILHEMGHVIGFGTIWQQLGLLNQADPDNPYFTGVHATAEYNTRFGTSDPGVPVEGQSGGPGTAFAHWRESVLDNELMTGFLNSGVANPISRITVGQWQDLGYQVNYAAAEPYARTGSNSVTVPLGEMTRPNAVVGPAIVTPPSHLVAIGAPIGDGIQIRLSGSASLDPSTITDNTITQSARHGLLVQTADSSSLPNLVVANNKFNDNGTGTDGSGVFFQREGSSTFNATVTNNEMNQNLGDGWSINTLGTAAPPMVVTSADNTYDSNAGHGTNFHTGETGVLTFTSNRDVYTSNGKDFVQLTALDDSTLNATFHNATITDGAVSGVNIFGANDGILNVTFDSPTDPLFTGTGTTIDGNLNGIVADITQFSMLTLNVTDTSIQQNTADGVNLQRSDAALILATFNKANISGNGGDGIEFRTQGSPPEDAFQQMTGEPNRLNLISSNLDGNTGGSGLNVATSGDSALVVQAQLTTFNDNGQDGIRVFSGDGSSFGYALTGERSIFDGITATGNGGSGVHVLAMGNSNYKSNVLVTLESVSGDTEISDNTNDGITASAPYGTVDLNVLGSGSGFQTLIQNNGDNGIEFNVANLAQDGADDALVTANFVNGVDFTSLNTYNGVGVLNIDGVIIGDENPNDGISDGNTGNGVALFNSNVNDLFTYLGTNLATVDVSVIGNRIGSLDVTINNTTIGGNGEDGINFLSQGLTDTFDDGNRNNLTVTNSHMDGNVSDGVSILLNGKNGNYDIDFLAGTWARTEYNQFVFDNNTFDSNGNYGFHYESNAGAITRYNFLSDGTVPAVPLPNSFWGLQFTDPSVNPGPFTVFNPNAVGAAGLPNYQFYDGPANGFEVTLSDFLNVVTDINSTLTFTNNQVRFNGSSNSLTGDGMFLNVGTDTYLSADVGGVLGSGNGNTFSGNAGSNVHFGSFVAYDYSTPALAAARTPLTPPASATGDPTDQVFLDDTAQLDLRFNNNVGRNLNANFFVPGAGVRSAVYTNDDPNKGGSFRATQLFQVDDGVNVNANNPLWVQDLEQALSPDGNFHLRSGADPLFPNPDFPQNYNTDPGNPFLP